MAQPPRLQPTLWRTCRVLANRTRLRILEILFQTPDQTVSELAKGLKCPVSLTSEYSRALEARGLLAVRRKGRRVVYRPGPTQGEGDAPRLVEALGAGFKRKAQPLTFYFKLATAFTHPRRIEIFRTISGGLRTPDQIRVATSISHRALRRHLEKLETRGFISGRRGTYTIAHMRDAFGRELARLAAEGDKN